MQIETASTLLLPLGIWLILSSGTPLQLHRRLAAASLIALAIASLSCYGTGYVFPLNNATQLGGLSAFMSYWSLAVACALLVAAVVAQSARAFAQVMLVTVAAGFVFPIVGRWVWGNGWLAALGANLNLGQGLVDLGRLSAVGLVAGAAAVSWLVRTPHRELVKAPELPPVHAPMRAVAGVICVLIGTIPPSLDPVVALGQFVNSSIAVSVAILTAGAYTLFTTRNTDVLSASRAALGAVFVASSGGALMPAWVLAALGVVCGLLATVGYYVVNERLRWRDDSAIVTSIFVASAIGMLATGLFANGVAGVSGMLPVGDNLPDPGQFGAQAAGLAAITLFAYAACAGVLALVARLGQPLLRPAEVAQTPAPAVAPSVAMSEVTATLPEVSITYSALAETAQTAHTVDAADSIEGAALPMDVAPTSAPASASVKGKGLLAWLRRSSPDPLTPSQPRRVAYPYRASGRRLTTRPLTADGEDEARPPLAPSE